MLYFVVDSCELKGCQYWRMGDSCVKNNKYIPDQLKYVANIHDGDNCIVRRQVNECKLIKLLEE